MTAQELMVLKRFALSEESRGIIVDRVDIGGTITLHRAPFEALVDPGVVLTNRNGAYEAIHPGMCASIELSNPTLKTIQLQCWFYFLRVPSGGCGISGGPRGVPMPMPYFTASK